MRFYIVAAICAVIAPQGTGAPNEREITAGLHKEYARSAKALRAHDLAGLMDTLAPDFTSSDPEGKTVTRAQMEEAFKQQMAQLQQVKSVDFTIKHIGIRSADEAIADSEMRLTGTVENPGSSKRHAYSIKSESVDTWVRSNGAWKLRHTQAGATTSTLDGKPVRTGTEQPAPKPTKAPKPAKAPKQPKGHK